MNAPTLPRRARQVIEYVAQMHHVSVADIIANVRTSRVLAARRHTFSDLNRLLRPDGKPFSAAQIGRWFGVEHSTVLYGIRQHRRRHKPFSRAPAYREPSPRNVVLLARIDALESYSAIARDVGLTPQRVGAIARRYGRSAKALREAA